MAASNCIPYGDACIKRTGYMVACERTWKENERTKQIVSRLANHPSLALALLSKLRVKV